MFGISEGAAVMYLLFTLAVSPTGERTAHYEPAGTNTACIESGEYWTFENYGLHLDHGYELHYACIPEKPVDSVQQTQ